MPHPRLAPDGLIIKQEDPAQPDVIELMRHGEAFPSASILQKVVIILRWMDSGGLRRVFSWPATVKEKPLQLARLFYTAAGRKLSGCGLKRPHEGKE
jgi:hypothetical protein